LRRRRQQRKAEQLARLLLSLDDAARLARPRPRRLQLALLSAGEPK
jgi:hypothetical protein